MPFTKPVADIYGGKASIYLVDPTDIENTAPHDNPLTADNLPRVIFHSDLPYYEAIFDQSVTLTIPARNSSASYDGLAQVQNLPNIKYVDHYPFGTGTTSDTPRAYLLYGSTYVDTWIEVQSSTSGGLTSKRWISLIASASPSPILRVRESFLIYNNGTTLPSLGLSLRGVAFRKVVASGTDLIDFNGSTNTFQFGRLLLNAASSSRLMRQASTGIPATADRTIDFSSTGVRIWNVQTGTFSDAGTYGGSYGGPTVRRIQ